jgi:hypothetical protein
MKGPKLIMLCRANRRTLAVNCRDGEGAPAGRLGVWIVVVCRCGGSVPGMPSLPRLTVA